ncbi:hypothetical protein ARMSODRAFT_63469 [Armillaria solidipes]|uniref:Uncharacterized protein n=1 Tax=Armillaria solidipes TaxID=1076256 RepID=A0A2H3C741_9AGAR|nr:hypothetical protein ARMSODRAFT_63469 [Armillaria solidipes]
MVVVYIVVCTRSTDCHHSVRNAWNRRSLCGHCRVILPTYLPTYLRRRYPVGASPSNTRDILENEPLDDVGYGMKRSRLRGDAKMNNAKETGDILALQPMQKPICREFRIVGPHLPKPTRDLPHPILPKLRVRPVVKIAYDLEPVGNGTRLDIMDGAS